MAAADGTRIVAVGVSSGADLLGRLLCSGQLAERRGEWESLLRKEGFRQVRSIQENEWLGTAWISSNG